MKRQFKRVNIRATYSAQNAYNTEADVYLKKQEKKRAQKNINVSN